MGWGSASGIRGARAQRGWRNGAGLRFLSFYSRRPRRELASESAKLTLRINVAQRRGVQHAFLSLVAQVDRSDIAHPLLGGSVTELSVTGRMPLAGGDGPPCALKVGFYGQ